LIIFLGNSCLNREDSGSIILSLNYSLNSYLNYNLHVVSRFIGRLTFGELIPNFRNLLKKKQKNKFSYLIGVDVDTLNIRNKADFVLYQGPYMFSDCYTKLNILLPSSNYIETEAMYLI
jgi:hypothetical protein